MRSRMEKFSGVGRREPTSCSAGFPDLALRKGHAWGSGEVICLQAWLNMLRYRISPLYHANASVNTTRVPWHESTEVHVTIFSSACSFSHAWMPRTTMQLILILSCRRHGLSAHESSARATLPHHRKLRRAPCCVEVVYFPFYSR